MTTVFLIYVFAAVFFLLILGIVCVKKTQVFTGLKSLLPSPEDKEDSEPDRVYERKPDRVCDLKPDEVYNPKPDGVYGMCRKVPQKEDLQSGVSQKPKINRRGTRNK